MVELEQVLKSTEELLSIPSVTGSEQEIADIPTFTPIVFATPTRSMPSGQECPSGSLC